MIDRIEHILRDYAAARHRYQECAEKTATLIGDLLREDGIRIHTIDKRSKDPEKLRDKLLRKWHHYKQLSDVTDLAAVRVICYFAEDVDKTARIIEREFIVDPTHSVDKRSLIEADRFGYVSMHHIVQWSPTRCVLTEHHRLKDLRVEIQTRSLLQHAWAEIEHDLGYKHVPVSRAIRRRFSRIAGLFELADMEFAEIRNALSPQKSIALELPSLAAFIATEPLVHQTDLEIAELRKSTLNEAADDTWNLLERLHLAGITTLDQIEQMFYSQRAAAVGMAREIFQLPQFKDNSGSLGPGISLFYTAYVVVAHRFTDDQLDAFRVKSGIELTVDEIRRTYANAVR